MSADTKITETVSLEKFIIEQSKQVSEIEKYLCGWTDKPFYLEELEKSWLKLPSFFLQDGRIRSPYYLEFLKKETKNFKKEMCGNWEHENEMPKMTMGIATIGSGSATGKQRFPDFELDALADNFLLDIEENRLPYERRKLEGIGKQIKALNEQIKLCEPIEPSSNDEIMDWVKNVFATPHLYKNPIRQMDFSHGIQIKEQGSIFVCESLNPVNYKEKIEEIAQKMPPFKKPKPKKKAKVSDFKKRINSFLRKK